MARLVTMTIGMFIALFCSFAMAQESRTPDLNSIVEALEKTQAGAHPQSSYQVLREYQLFGTNDSKAKSEVVAEIEFRPPTSKDYRIQSSSGSNRGEEVVRRILDHEIEAASKGNHARTALNRDNYSFGYKGEAMLDGQPCYILELRPKRKETELVSGEAWVDEHSFFVRQIEGEVAKTPSWWLKKVHVKLTFADVGGTWLQTRMEAVADVRVVGSQTLTSRILDYRGAAEVATTTHHKWQSAKHPVPGTITGITLLSPTPAF